PLWRGSLLIVASGGHFFFDFFLAGFALGVADFFAAFLVAFGLALADFAGLEAGLPADDFFAAGLAACAAAPFEKARSQFSQKAGVAPVRTIGPLIVCSLESKCYPNPAGGRVFRDRKRSGPGGACPPEA